MNGSSGSPRSPSDEKYLAATLGGGERNCIGDLAMVRAELRGGGVGVIRLSLGHSDDVDSLDDEDSLDNREEPRAPDKNILDNEIMLK